MSEEDANALFEDTFCLDFSASLDTGLPGSETAVVPLCDGGQDTPVNLQNRDEFVALLHHFLMHSSVEHAFEHFAQGFRRVCDSPLLDVLSPEELERIVAGMRDLDFTRLRQGATYEGYLPSDPYVQSFWEVLNSLDATQKRQFLSFCTGSDLAPVGGLQELRILIQRHGEEPTNRLPVAHTCFNLLLLPRYSSVEKLKSLLVMAIECTEGFGLQ
jgi:hypothetical protein